VDRLSRLDCRCCIVRFLVYCLELWSCEALMVSRRGEVEEVWAECLKTRVVNGMYASLVWLTTVMYADICSCRHDGRLYWTFACSVRAIHHAGLEPHFCSLKTDFISFMGYIVDACCLIDVDMLFISDMESKCVGNLYPR
jgi:hypothetical protein